MKNLFKNLMLVAVAAMAFTACTETNDEVNAVVEKTVLKFVAGFDEETRSGFDGKNDAGDGYKSSWDGDETLKVCANGAFASAQEVRLEDAEGHFTVEFEGTVPTLIDVYSPASAWNSEHYPTVPAVQTPRANSVDPAAHILKAQAASVESGVVTMSHKFAYGKMTVNTPAEFTISKVELSLVGLPYGWTEDQTYSYTINATNVENNTFWFTTEALNHVKEFTVTAYNADGDKYAKTVTGLDEGKLKFVVGQVSTFSVSNLEAVVEPEGLVFTSAKWSNSYNDKLVQFYTADGATLQLNWYNCGSDAWIVPNTYGFASSGAIYPGGQYSWYENTAAGIDTEIVAGTVIVSVVDGQYYIEFKNLADYSAVQIESATFTGEITGLQVPDMRTQLAAPSNVTYSADGKTITLSWTAVEGADGYRVKLYSPYDEYFEEIVTTNEYVYEAQLYSTLYSFTIMSYASDTNAQYRSSEDAYAYVTTGQDPDKWADVVATDIKWDSNGYFTLTAPGFSYFYLEVNSANRPNNNSLVVGDYTYGKNENQFRVRYNNGYVFNYSDISNTSTMTVNFVDDQYVILLNVTSLYGGFVGTIGYKGMPEGWVAPSEGGSGNEGGSGDEGGSDDPVDELGTVNNPYTFTTCDVFAAQFPKLTFSGAEDGATLTLESNTSYGLPEGVVTLGNNGWWPTGHSYSLGDIDYGYSYSSIDKNADGSYTINYIMIKSGSKTVYYRYSGGSVL